MKRDNYKQKYLENENQKYSKLQNQKYSQLKYQYLQNQQYLKNQYLKNEYLKNQYLKNQYLKNQYLQNQYLNLQKQNFLNKKNFSIELVFYNSQKEYEEYYYQKKELLDEFENLNSLSLLSKNFSSEERINFEEYYLSKFANLNIESDFINNRKKSFKNNQEKKLEEEKMTYKNPKNFTNEVKVVKNEIGTDKEKIEIEKEEINEKEEIEKKNTFQNGKKEKKKNENSTSLLLENFGEKKIIEIPNLEKGKAILEDKEILKKKEIITKQDNFENPFQSSINSKNNILQKNFEGKLNNILHYQNPIFQLVQNNSDFLLSKKEAEDKFFDNLRKNIKKDSDQKQVYNPKNDIFIKEDLKNQISEKINKKKKLESTEEELLSKYINNEYSFNLNKNPQNFLNENELFLINQNLNLKNQNISKQKQLSSINTNQGLDFKYFLDLPNNNKVNFPFIKNDEYQLPTKNIGYSFSNYENINTSEFPYLQNENNKKLTENYPYPQNPNKNNDFNIKLSFPKGQNKDNGHFNIKLSMQEKDDRKNFSKGYQYLQNNNKSLYPFPKNQPQIQNNYNQNNLQYENPQNDLHNPNPQNNLQYVNPQNDLHNPNPQNNLQYVNPQNNLPNPNPQNNLLFPNSKNNIFINPQNNLLFQKNQKNSFNQRQIDNYNYLNEQEGWYVEDITKKSVYKECRKLGDYWRGKSHTYPFVFKKKMNFYYKDYDESFIFDVYDLNRKKVLAKEDHYF